MIPAGVQVFLALDAVDLRYGFERLAGLVHERFGYDARSGALFVFVSKRGTTVKIAFADPSGVCLFWKRLDRGSFVLPPAPVEGATHLEVDEATLQTLLDGIAIAPSPATPRTSPRRIH